MLVAVGLPTKVIEAGGYRCPKVLDAVAAKVQADETRLE